MPLYAIFSVDNPIFRVKTTVDSTDSSKEASTSAIIDSPSSKITTADPAASAAWAKAADDFLKDIFRTAANLYPDWDEVVLNFDLNKVLPTLTFSREAKPEAGRTIELRLSDASTSPTAGIPEDYIQITSVQLDNLRRATADGVLKLSVQDLKSRPETDPVVMAIGNGTHNTFYGNLSRWFINYFMDERDKANLIHYVGQNGTFAYGGYFFEIKSDKSNGNLFASVGETATKQNITESDNADQYFITSEQLIREKNLENPNLNKNFCTIITRARYDRTTGKIIGPLMITLQFPDNISATEANIKTKRLIAAYEAQRKLFSSTSDSPRDIGALRVITPQPLLSRLAAVLGGIILIAGIICAALVALHILPTLAFLADLSLNLGALSITGPPLSALVLVVATFFATTTTAMFSFFSTSLVTSHKSPLITHSTLAGANISNLGATPVLHASRDSLGSHPPAKTVISRPSSPNLSAKAKAEARRSDSDTDSEAESADGTTTRP